ncbi:MAG: EAL domain-containing protein [Bdellovibrionota bacterium]|nr:EAL domain-containing protein [Bdellovibrionota bacterium]
MRYRSKFVAKNPEKKNISKFYSKRKYVKDEIIFRQGDDGDSAFIIENGRVEIFVGDDDAHTPVAVLGVGEIFGEMAIIDSSTRAASAKAIEDVQLTVVSQDQLAERINLADPIVRLLISMLLQRSRENFALHTRNVKSKNTVAIPAVVAENTSASKLRLVGNENFDPPSEFGFGGESKEQAREDALKKIKMESELQSALENDDFQLFYQPVIDFRTKKIAGFEALIRWEHAEMGMVRPDIFMGIAEESSLIIPIGQWVMQQACRDSNKIRESIRDWSNIKKNFFVSVNVSGRQLNDPEFFEVLEEASLENHVIPSTFKLEITERVLVGGQMVENWITECHRRGFTVALDDFGTGYSSLSYLSQFHVDNLKIDRSFVRKIHDDKKTRVIVKAIIELAKGLGIPLIAEGIETEKDAQVLKKWGCHYAQGYLYARPMPLSDIVEFLRSIYQKAG